MMAVVHMQARLTALLVSPRLCILYPFFQIQANAPRQMPRGSPIWGFSNGLFNQAMTSGEALWHDIDQGKIVLSEFFAIERAQCDALAWAEGLRIELTELHKAQAVLLMGLPDAAKLADWQPFLDQAFAADLPIYCSNPDQHSPRADGLVISAGTLARAYSQRSGQVIYYLKPH